MMASQSVNSADIDPGLAETGHKCPSSATDATPYPCPLPHTLYPTFEFALASVVHLCRSGKPRQQAGTAAAPTFPERRTDGNRFEC